MEPQELDRLLTLREVCKATGLAPSRVYEKIREGTFPSNWKVGVRAVRWRLSEVRGWMDALPQGVGATVDGE